MISISLSHYSQTSHTYKVILGNGTIHEFNSEKKCHKFLSRTSKFLTKRYNELNLIYSDVFSLYRQIYFYFDNNRHSRHADLYELRRRINKLFNSIEILFEKLSFSSNFTTSNQLQFSQLNSIIESLIEVSILIKQINENKSYASTQVRAEFLIHQLTTIQTDIKFYALDKATAYAQPDQNTSLINYKTILKIVS